MLKALVGWYHFGLVDSCLNTLCSSLPSFVCSDWIEPVTVQVTTESSMVERSLQFEQAISGGDRATLASFCEAQAQQGGPQDQETWRFLRVNFEEDARR